MKTNTASLVEQYTEAAAVYLELEFNTRYPNLLKGESTRQPVAPEKRRRFFKTDIKKVVTAVMIDGNFQPVFSTRLYNVHGGVYCSLLEFLHAEKKKAV